MSVAATEADVRLRHYEPGDEHGIVRLFQRVFDAQFDLDVWRWKYLQSPWARPELCAVAVREDGEIVGHLGLMMHALNCVGSSQPFGQISDLMVELRARGANLSAALFDLCIARGLETAVPVYAGFPRQRAFGPTLRVARHVAILEKYQLTLGSAAHERLRAGMESAAGTLRKGLGLNPEYKLEPGLDPIWRSCARLENLSFWRDRPYLHWKYEQGRERHRFLALEKDQQVAALGVCREKDGEVWLVDLIVRERSVVLARELVLRAADYYRARGFEALRFAGSDPWFFAEVFAEFEKRPAFWGSFVARALDPATAFLYENPLNWTLARGDFDS